MDSELKQVIQKYRAESVYHSHISMINPKGKFQLNKQQLENFWEVYMKLVNENPQTISGIAEKPQHYMPVLADVDLKMEQHDDDDIRTLHSKEDIERIIEIYQSVMRNIIDDCTDEYLTCVVLEKKPYWVDAGGKSYMKHGLHLHWPFCFMNKIDQEVQLIPRVKKLMKETKMFEKVGYENSGDVIDKACCTNAWLLYGSRKLEKYDPYLFSNVYDHNTVETTLEKAFKNYSVYDHKEQKIPIAGNVEYYLPRILSIIPHERPVCEIKTGLASPVKNKIKKKEVSSFRKTSVTEALRIAKKLIPMIAQWRAEEHNEWMNIGWALYNIGDGCPEALELWCDFSSQCEDKYDESTCIYHWERMVVKDLTLGTIRFYAKTDNSEEYSKFKAEEASSHVQEAFFGSHYNIAQIMHSEYGDEFICASISNKMWFQFKDHHWQQMEEGIFLRKKISEEIVQKFAEEGKQSFTHLNSLSGGMDRKSAEEGLHSMRIKQSHKMMNNLNSNTYKNSVMKECAEVFYDKRFKEKLDNNTSLICFKNGVYDLKTHTHRAGRPEDFISKTLPIDYKEFSPADEKVQEIYQFLEQVFPDKSIRQYFMKTSSEAFIGGNHRKIVVFWTGEGDNGKSVTQSFFEKLFGPLAIKFNTTVVTGKKVSNGAANAEMARAGGGVRWAVLEEPDGDEMINVGILKNMSGNDSIFARDLFEKGKDTREITPMFKLTFICNKLPKLKHADKATFNRIRVLPFESTFCRPDDPAPETYEEQLRQKRFPMDPNFGRKIPGLLEAFAWVLLDYYKQDIPYVEPEKVLSATAIYKKQNDIYRQFIEECISEDKTKILTLTELYTQFKDWFRDSLPNHTVPVKNDIEEYFSKLWGEPDIGKKWKGYRIRTLQDQINDGSAIVLDDEDLVDYTDNSNFLPQM